MVQARFARLVWSAEPAYRRSPRYWNARARPGDRRAGHRRRRHQVLGHISKAIAAGADSVMIGSLFAGTDESPGEIILFQGRSFKSYPAWLALGDERRQPRPLRPGKRVPDVQARTRGIEGRVPHKGPLASLVHQLVGGLRAGMGYCGCRTIAELHEKGDSFGSHRRACARATFTT